MLAIRDLLLERAPMTARQIAQALKMNKTTVNRYLYNNPSMFTATTDVPPSWFAAHESKGPAGPKHHVLVDLGNVHDVVPNLVRIKHPYWHGFADPTFSGPGHDHPNVRMAQSALPNAADVWMMRHFFQTVWQPQDTVHICSKDRLFRCLEEQKGSHKLFFHTQWASLKSFVQPSNDQ